MDSNLPVDIKLSGLGDWLSSRRYVHADWAKAVKVVRQKIAAAILDMPEHPRILELLSNSYINYYNCREIVEILKETEKDSQNFFGFYSSQRMKDWKEIVSLYEKDNLHIAEAAQQLNQLVKFDIPALKKELSNQEKKIADRLENSKAQLKQAEDLKKAYHAELNRRGLKGDNLRLEFFRKTESLDEICAEVEKKLKELPEARQYYADMRSFVLGDNDKLLLPMLLLFQETKGEATAYQWIHKTVPTSINRPNFSEILSKLVNPEEEEIDFGDDLNLDDVDYGDLDAQDDITDFSTGAVILEGEPTEVSDRVAVGQEALSLVQNEVCREHLKGELAELRVFLKSAVDDQEREHPSTMILSGYISTSNEINVSASRIKTWIKHIDDILKSLNNSDTIELFQIRTDPGYVQQLIDQVREPIEKSRRLEDCSTFAVNDVATMKENYQQSVGKAKEAIAKAGKLEKQLCVDLEKFTKGRPIHLIGGVKSVEVL